MQGTVGIATRGITLFLRAKLFVVGHRRPVEQRGRHQPIGPHLVVIGGSDAAGVGIKLAVEFEGFADAPLHTDAITAVGGGDVAFTDVFVGDVTPLTGCQSLRINLDVRPLSLRGSIARDGSTPIRVRATFVKVNGRTPSP